MRDLKFRSWDKREGLQRMIYLNGFIPYGDGWRGGNPDYKFYQLYYGDKGCSSADAKDIEIMQYTGLKDKNGKEIYEGDIIESDYGIGTVEFDQTTCRFTYSFSLDTDALWHYTKSAKVVGNIYENPELIEK